MGRLFYFILAATALAACSKPHVIKVTNNSDIPRDQEIVAIDLEEIRNLNIGPSFVLKSESGEEVPYQITHDKKVIFPVSTMPHHTVSIKIERGEPSFVDTIVCGAFYPRRKDDLAWENDKSAYRAYGPALEESGERAFGYDIWTKSVVTPVVAKRYHEALDLGLPYHQDRGEGMDVYTVGPTLGAGATAMLDSAGNLVYPWAFRDYEILDNGPLRFTVKLTYPSGETRQISLDKGEYLNRTTVSYPLTKPQDIAAGIVVHRQNPDGFEISRDGKFMAYADLTDNANKGNGVIYIGIVSQEADTMINLPLNEPEGDAIGHILAMKSYKPGEDYTYYWGSGWSKGYMPDWDSWISYLNNFQNRLTSPLETSVE